MGGLVLAGQMTEARNTRHMLPTATRVQRFQAGLRACAQWQTVALTVAGAAPELLHQFGCSAPASRFIPGSGTREHL